MYLIVICFLIAILYWVYHIAHKCDVGKFNSSSSLCDLQYKFYAVYFPATFADWLQGPYLYKLYSVYGFREDEIFLLYIAGFASSVVFGTCISCLADWCGRKKMCIIFNVIYILSCLTKLSSNFEMLVFGRILGGIGSSILFSVFEAWYIYQHIEKHQFPVSWINNTLSKTTFYNGFLAILAGLISNVFAELLEIGPIFPFMLAIPCLTVSATLALLLWDETHTLQNNSCFDSCNMVKSLFKREIASLCFIQSVFESVMYVFIILWTPVLSPISPPLGIVFSCFMICIMIGSSLHNVLVVKKCQPNTILTVTMLIGSAALSMCVMAEISIPTSCSYSCFMAFLLYEVAVGLYYPAIGFIRSCIIPERFRAGLISSFRMPMNLITCMSLLYFRHKEFGDKDIDYKFSHVPGKINSNVQIFAMCALALLGATAVSRNFKIHSDRVQIVKSINEF